MGLPYQEIRDLGMIISEVRTMESRYQELRVSGGPEAFEAMDDLHRKVLEAYELEDRIFQQIVSVLEQGF